MKSDIEIIEPPIYRPKNTPNRAYALPLQKMNVGEAFDIPCTGRPQANVVSRLCRHWANRNGIRITTQLEYDFVRITRML